MIKYIEIFYMFLILNGCLMHYTLADLGCDTLDQVTWRDKFH